MVYNLDLLDGLTRDFVYKIKLEFFFVPEGEGDDEGEGRNAVVASRSKGCWNVVYCIYVEIQTKSNPEK